MAMGASIALMGSNVGVRAHKCFGRCGIGPNVAATTNTGTVLEFHHVDSVEKVCRIAEHLDLAVDAAAAKCLELCSRANKALDEDKHPELAVLLYTASLDTGYEEQAGVVLVGRAAARLDLARRHGETATAMTTNYVSATGRRVKVSREQARARLLMFVGASYAAQDGRPAEYRPIWTRLLGRRRRATDETPAISGGTSPVAGVALRALSDCRADDAELAAVDFEFNMHKIEIRRALADALAATDRLPSYSRCWRVAAEALSVAGGHDAQAARFFQ